MQSYNIIAATTENTVVTSYEPTTTRADSYQSEAALALCRAGGVQLARTAGLAGPVDRPGAVTACDEEAALWLRANTPAGTGLATNRTSSAPPPSGEDGISNVYTAFSGVQCYMEGWTYAMSNMGVPADEVEHRRAVVAAVFDPATPADEREVLCRREGVTCLVWAKRWPGSLPPGKHPVFVNAEVAIYWV